MSVVEKEMRKNSYSETEKTILNIAALTVGLILIYVFNYERIISVGKWCDVLVKGILDLFLIHCCLQCCFQRSVLRGRAFGPDL